MNIRDIKSYSTTTDDNVHESMLRSYHILELVLEMIERGDSKESIFDVVKFLRE